MTEAERQQVIDALEIGRRYLLTTPEHLASVAAALAIMRRDAQQHEELARQMREHDAGGS